MSDIFDRLEPELGRLARYSLRTDLTAGDILTACGDTDRNKLNAVLFHALGAKAKAHQKTRRFSGVQVLSLAAVYSMYIRDLAAPKSLRGIYNAIARLDEELGGDEPYEPSPWGVYVERGRNEGIPPGSVFLRELHGQFYVLKPWLSTDFPWVLLGISMPDGRTRWTVTTGVSCRDRQSGPFVLVDLIDLMLPISERIPEIPRICQHPGIYDAWALSGDTTEDEPAYLSIRESRLLDCIRDAQGHTQVMVSVTDSEIQRIDFDERDLSPKSTSPRTLLSDPETVSVTSDSDGSGHVARYHRHVRIKFQ